MRNSIPRSTRRLLAPLCAALLIACGDDGDPPAPEPMEADLSVAVDGPGQGAVGEDLVYDVTVQNDGPATATDVRVTAEPSAGVMVTDVSDGGAFANGEVSWPAIANLASGASRSFSVTLIASAAGDVGLSASAISDTDDPDASNNDGSGDAANATTAVSVAADVFVTQSGPSLVEAGAEFTYEVTVENAGPSPAMDVVTVDSLAFGTEVVDVTGGGQAADSIVTWPPLDLESGESMMFTVTARAPLVGPLTARAAATASSPDPLPANNDGSSGVARVRTLIGFEEIDRVVGDAANDQFGWEMFSLGDVDGDGAGDFVVTGITAGGQARGAVYVYSGASGTRVRMLEGDPGDTFGYDAAVLDDVSGDGIVDLAVGVPQLGGNQQGAVGIYSVADGVLLEPFAGESPGDGFGLSVDAAGDVDGDGEQDLVVGAPGNDAAGAGFGRAYVYSGADWSLIRTHDGPGTNSGFGTTVAGVGDVDGDGFDDVAVSAPNVGPGGRVFVYSGQTGNEIRMLDADATGAGFGVFWVSTPGDLTGDGRPDIYVGDINDGTNGPNAGRGYVFSGADGSRVFTLEGEVAGDQFGIAHPAGDLDGDGVGDLIIAAWLSSEGGSQAGKVYIYSGADRRLIRTFTSTVAGENFGFDAVVVDDLNGDGVPDVIVSGGISQTTPGHVRIIAGVALQ